MELSPWSSEDEKQHKILDNILSKNISWNLTTTELIQAYRSLVWFASLKDKINKSTAEILSVKYPKEKKPKGKGVADV